MNDCQQEFIFQIRPGVKMENDNLKSIIIELDNESYEIFPPTYIQKDTEIQEINITRLNCDNRDSIPSKYLDKTKRIYLKLLNLIRYHTRQFLLNRNLIIAMETIRNNLIVHGKRIGPKQTIVEVCLRPDEKKLIEKPLNEVIWKNIENDMKKSEYPDDYSSIALLLDAKYSILEQQYWESVILAAASL